MIYNSSIWIRDIDKIIDNLPVLDELRSQSVLITGAGGLVCSAVADVLIRYNETHKGDIHIFLAGRSEERMKCRFGQYLDNEYIHFIFFDAEKGLCMDESFKFDYIIHGAGNAYPEMIVKEPVETMLSNILGLKSLLDYAKDNELLRLLFISSSEVYGKKEDNEPYQEDQYGYIDLLNPRNSYSAAKRAAETMCAAYQDEYGVDSVIVRPGHIYGPTASDTDDRVSSAWSYAAARGEDILMKSEGAQMRSYCYCLDSAAAILTVLLKGERMQAYNISVSDSVISIKEMAQLLAKSMGVRVIRMEPTEAERKGFNPMSNSSLNGKSLQALGWKCLFDAETGFSHTVKILKDIIRR